MNLENLTTEQLHAELNRRKEEQKRLEAEKRKEVLKKVLDNRDLLLEFAKHSRGSCGCGSDADANKHNAGYHPENGAGYCPRCNLLDLEEWDDDVGISIDIRFQRKVS